MSTVSKFALALAFLAGVTLPALAQDSTAKQPLTTAPVASKADTVKSDTKTDTKSAATAKTDAAKAATAKADAGKTDPLKTSAKQPAATPSTTKIN